MRATNGASTGEVNVRKGNLVLNPTGTFIRNALEGYPLALALDLRRRLRAKFPGLAEKLNTNSRYLGYHAPGRSDRLYVYVQKGKIVLDVRVGRRAHWEAELERHGLHVHRRKNFQGRVDWLTGVRVPHDTDHADLVLRLCVEALRGA